MNLSYKSQIFILKLSGLCIMYEKQMNLSYKSHVLPTEIAQLENFESES